MALFSFPQQVNERAARLVAGVIASVGLLALATQTWWLVPLLSIGFFLRVGWGPRVSPLARFAVAVAPRLWEVKPVTGAPKRFAQGIGAAVTLLATALLASGAIVPGWALIGVLVVFASLEAALSFCFGCWVYGRLQSAGLIAPDVCTNCAPQAAKA
jgi:Domain of unknown function (DUF4395)